MNKPKYQDLEERYHYTCIKKSYHLCDKCLWSDCLENNIYLKGGNNNAKKIR